MAKVQTSPVPRAKDVAAALRLLGVEASHIRSPKSGKWLVKAGRIWILPIEGGFKVAGQGIEEREISRKDFVSFVAEHLAR